MDAHVAIVFATHVRRELEARVPPGRCAFRLMDAVRTLATLRLTSRRMRDAIVPLEDECMRTRVSNTQKIQVAIFKGYRATRRELEACVDSLTGPCPPDRDATYMGEDLLRTILCVDSTISRQWRLGLANRCLDLGADPTSAIVAACKHYPELVPRLLELDNNGAMMGNEHVREMLVPDLVRHQELASHRMVALDLLLDRGCSPHAIRHCATSEAITVLLDRGASLFGREDGSTDLTYLLRHGATQTVAMTLLRALAKHPDRERVRAYVDDRDFHGLAAMGYTLNKKGATKALLRLGADPSAWIRGAMGNVETALHHWISKEDTEMVRLLLASGADPNYRDPQGKTVLMYARHLSSYLEADPRGVGRLLEAGADPGLFDYGNPLKTAVHYALENGSAALVEALMDHVLRCPDAITLAAKRPPIFHRLTARSSDLDVDRYDPIRQATPLSVAVQSGNLCVAKILLEKGADPFSPHPITFAPSAEFVAAPRQGTLFHCAINSGVAEAFVEHLLGISDKHVDAADSTGRTPLMDAARTDQTWILGRLLDKGADPDARDKDGKSALFYVKSTKAVEVLLRGRAEPNFVDVGGQTALNHVAATRHHKAYRVAVALVKGGVDPNVGWQRYRGDNMRTTPLIWACRWSGSMRDTSPSHELVAEMLLRGADPNARGERKEETAMMVAAETLPLDVIKVMYAAGGDPDLQDSEGRDSMDRARSQTIRQFLFLRRL